MGCCTNMYRWLEPYGIDGGGRPHVRSPPQYQTPQMPQLDPHAEVFFGKLLHLI
jgi:hypothetical protein